MNMSEHVLSKQLGMSKTPVHEALLDLTLRWFVTLIARKGEQIRKLTIDEIKDLYEFRLVLEIAAHAGSPSTSHLSKLSTSGVSTINVWPRRPATPTGRGL